MSRSLRESNEGDASRKAPSVYGGLAMEEPANDGLFARLFPPLERAERLALVESLTESSRWSLNFGVLLSCSVLIAGLGLLQNSVAVIIGAMLVAPLMTPLIGMGLALVQGNFKLLREATLATVAGVAMSLALGVLLRLAIPGSELSPEILSRAAPNVLDLLIAFLAGVAAGYAMARPKLSGALPGVAISVALVPPLAASGIALGAGNWVVSMGALLLFSTNMVAIILASSLVFRIVGIRKYEQRGTVRVLMKRVVICLGLVMLLMSAPLIHEFAVKQRVGLDRPTSLALPEYLWNAIYHRVEEEEGITMVAGIRAGVKRPHDVTIVLAADEAVPEVLMQDVDRMLDYALGKDVKTKVIVVPHAQVVQVGLEDPEPELKATGE